MRRCLSQANHVDPGFVIRVRVSVDDYHDFKPSAQYRRAYGVPSLLSVYYPVRQRLGQWIGENLLRQGEIQTMLADIPALLVCPPGDMHEPVLVFSAGLRRKDEQAVHGSA
jgi:hypothetical protein